MTFFDTVSDLTAASLTDGQIVATKGYHSVGDAGAAQYLIQTSIQYGGTPDGYGDHTLANGNVAVLQCSSPFDVRLFGAAGDNSNDDTAAIQACIDYVSEVGGVVYLPSATYRTTSTLTVESNPENFFDVTRVSVKGDGAGVSRINYQGAATTGAVLELVSNDTANTDNTAVNTWVPFSGFEVSANNVADQGLKVLAKSWFLLDDIKVDNAVNRNFNIQSAISFSARGLRSYGGSYGIFLEHSAEPLAYSNPNNVTLMDVTVGNASSFGIYARNPGPVNIYGGSVEGNGTQSTADTGGIAVLRNDSGIGIEKNALNLYDMYLEKNAGEADIKIYQQSSSQDCLVNINNVTFNRISSTTFTENNIRSEVVGSKDCVINVYGCGFNYGNDYVPSSSYPMLGRTGLVAQTYVNCGKTCVFSSSVDSFEDLNGPFDIPKATCFAAARIEGTGGIVTKHNISSVNNTSAGVYEVYFEYPSSSSSPVAVATAVGSNCRAQIYAESTDKVNIGIQDETNTNVNSAFNIIVFDA